MSIIVQGDHMVLEQIMKQLAKLEEVMRVVHLEEDMKSKEDKRLQRRVRTPAII